jgi:hypothetical protein
MYFYRLTSGGCRVWILYATDYVAVGEAEVFMQYWLLDWGSSKCPTGFQRSSGTKNCYRNSTLVPALLQTGGVPTNKSWGTALYLMIVATLLRRNPLAAGQAGPTPRPEPFASISVPPPGSARTDSSP